MAKKLRDTARAFCECEGIIHLPNPVWLWKRIGSEESFRHRSIATIRLRRNTKTKMMPLLKIHLSALFQDFDGRRRPKRQRAGFLKMISTLKRWVPLATTIFMAVTPALEYAK